MLRKNIRKRRMIEDSLESNAYFTLENSDNLVNMSPRSNVTEISFNQSFEEDEFENFIEDNIEPNKKDISFISQKINETKEIKYNDFQKLKQIKLENSLISANSKEAQDCNNEIERKVSLINQGINEINDDIPKIKNLISKLNQQNIDMMKTAKTELKSFTELEKSMEIEFKKGYSQIKELKENQAKIALHNYNKLFKSFTDTVKKSFEEVIKIINRTNKAGEIYQIMSDTYFRDINTELKGFEINLMDFELLEDFKDMHENLRELNNPAKNIHERTKEKCNDFKNMNKDFLNKQKVSNSKIKINETKCKIFLDKMIKMRKKIYEKVSIEMKKQGKQIDIPQNEINKAMTNLIEEFEKESGKISNDGNYSIEKLYNMKQGFEKVSENNRKEMKKVLKAEERKMQNISEDLDIVKKFTIDILILMDITGSMGSYLSEAKTFLKNLVKDLISSFIGLTVRLSFIGYRDFDRNLKEEEYVNIDFTENHEFIKNSISDCQATGGGDTCEDVAGALEKGLNKNWNSKARYAILVCDAPAHGKKYHNNQDDSFPQGDPKGRNIEKFIDEFHNLNVNFFCVEISSITNVMLNCFRNIYKNQNVAKGKELIFEVQKLTNSSELKNYIFQTSRKVYEVSRK
jgi:myosin protein heavy chain